MQPVFELMTEHSDVAGTFGCLGSTAEQMAVPTELHFSHRSGCSAKLLLN